MNSFEINKIITAILVTILVVFGIGKISDAIFIWFLLRLKFLVEKATPLFSLIVFNFDLFSSC